MPSSYAHGPQLASSVSRSVAATPPVTDRRRGMAGAAGGGARGHRGDGAGETALDFSTGEPGDARASGSGHVGVDAPLRRRAWPARIERCSMMARKQVSKRLTREEIQTHTGWPADRRCMGKYPFKHHGDFAEVGKVHYYWLTPTDVETIGLLVPGFEPGKPWVSKVEAFLLGRCAMNPQHVRDMSVPQAVAMIREHASVARPSVAKPIDETALLAPTDLAKQFKLNAEALRKKLGRWRKTNHEGWIENTERKQHEPKYLYRVSAVLPILRTALKASAETSGERPAKKS